MNMLNQLGQSSKSVNQIFTETDRMWGCKPDTLEAGHIVNGFEQLNKWAFPIHVTEFVPSVQIHDLTKQSHFLDTAIDQRSNLIDNFLNGAAALMSASERDDAECAMHVAALHNRNESVYLSFVKNVVPDSALGILLFLDVNDGKADVLKTRRRFSLERLIDVIGDPMEFLRAHNQVEMRHLVQERRATALRHASQKAVDDRAVARQGPKHAHFTQGLLLGQITHATSV